MLLLLLLCLLLTPDHKTQCQFRSLVIGYPVIWSNHCLLLLASYFLRTSQPFLSIDGPSCCIFIYVIFSSYSFFFFYETTYSSRYTLTNIAKQTTNTYNIRDMYMRTTRLLCKVDRGVDWVGEMSFCSEGGKIRLSHNVVLMLAAADAEFLHRWR